MPKRIDVGSEIIEFPDSMPDSEIEAVLAKQFPAPKPKPATAGEMAMRGLKGMVVNPIVNAASGFWDAATRGGDPVANMARDAVLSHVKQGQRAADSFKRGKTTAGVADTIMTMVPVVGPALGAIAERATPHLESGDYAALAEDAGEAIGTSILPEAMPSAVAAFRGPARTAKAVVKGGGKAAMQQVRPVLKASKVMEPGPATLQYFESAKAVLDGIRNELTANKVASHRSANPGGQLPPGLPPEAIPEAAPIPGGLPSGRQPGPINVTRQSQLLAQRSPGARVAPDVVAPVEAAPIPGDLPSGRRPMTRGELILRNAPQPRQVRTPDWQNLPEMADPLAETAPIPGTLPSGRRPMTAAERAARYEQPNVVGPTQRTTVEPSAPLDRAGPEAQAAAEGLADEFPELRVDRPPLGSEYPARDYLAGKSAEKAMNFAHEFERVGIPVEDMAAMTGAQWKQVTDYLNGLRNQEWVAGGKKGPEPKNHTPPSSRTIAQIEKYLKDSAARKANPQ